MEEQGCGVVDGWGGGGRKRRKREGGGLRISRKGAEAARPEKFKQQAPWEDSRRWPTPFRPGGKGSLEMFLEISTAWAEARGSPRRFMSFGCSWEACLRHTDMGTHLDSAPYPLGAESRVIPGARAPAWLRC